MPRKVQKHSTKLHRHIALAIINIPTISKCQFNSFFKCRYAFYILAIANKIANRRRLAFIETNRRMHSCIAPCCNIAPKANRQYVEFLIGLSFLGAYIKLYTYMKYMRPISKQKEKNCLCICVSELLSTSAKLFINLNMHSGDMLARR